MKKSVLFLCLMVVCLGFAATASASSEAPAAEPAVAEAVTAVPQSDEPAQADDAEATEVVASEASCAAETGLPDVVFMGRPGRTCTPGQACSSSADCCEYFPGGGLGCGPCKPWGCVCP